MEDCSTDGRPRQETLSHSPQETVVPQTFPGPTDGPMSGNNVTRNTVLAVFCDVVHRKKVSCYYAVYPVQKNLSVI